MFKRLFWLTVGLTLGYGSSFWFMRKVRRTVERLMPERLSHDVVAGARSWRAHVSAAVDEGKAGMREREAELRAELGRRRPPGRPLELEPGRPSRF